MTSAIAILRPLSKWLSSGMRAIESRKISPVGWTVCLVAIVAVRDFLEAFSSANLDMIASADKSSTDFTFYHTPLFYFSIFLGLAVILRLFTREKVPKILNFVLVLSGMIFIAPSVDLIIGAFAGKRTPIAYDVVINVKNLGDLIKYWLDFTFFGPYGVFFDGHLDTFHDRQNLGIRTEVNLILLVASSYVFWKTRSSIRTIGAYFVMNAGFMVYVSFPIFLWLAASVFPKHEGVRLFPETVGVTLGPSNLTYFLSILAFASVLLHWANPKKFIAMISNLRIGRIMNLLILLAFGLFLGFGAAEKPFAWSDIFDPIAVLVLILALVFEWFAAICHNDLEDEEGDRLSMSHRPLPAGIVTRDEMFGYAWLFGVVALYAANLAGHAVFVVVAFKAAFHFLYSSKEFRLKAIPLVSNLVLSLTYLLTVLAGYLFAAPNGLHAFPSGAALMILVTFTLATPFKDLKDVDGDRKVGVRTIPTLFGLEKGKKIIAALGFLGFCFVPVAMSKYFEPLIIPSIIGGCAFAWAVTRKNYQEWKVFWVYYLYAGISATAIALW